MQSAAERMKRNADEKRREIQLEVGDRVLLSTWPLKLVVVGTAKFKPQFVGPFEVIMKNGTVAYKLKLPDTMSKLHPMVPCLALEVLS